MYLRAFHYCDLICFLEKGNFSSFEKVCEVFIYSESTISFVCTPFLSI